jgi:hypothetical protein
MVWSDTRALSALAKLQDPSIQIPAHSDHVSGTLSRDSLLLTDALLWTQVNRGSQMASRDDDDRGGNYSVGFFMGLLAGTAIAQAWAFC